MLVYRSVVHSKPRHFPTLFTRPPKKKCPGKFSPFFDSVWPAKSHPEIPPENTSSQKKSGLSSGASCWWFRNPAFTSWVLVNIPLFAGFHTFYIAGFLPTIFLSMLVLVRQTNSIPSLLQLGFHFLLSWTPSCTIVHQNHLPKCFGKIDHWSSEVIFIHLQNNALEK